MDYGYSSLLNCNWRKLEEEQIDDQYQKFQNSGKTIHM